MTDRPGTAVEKIRAAENARDALAAALARAGVGLPSLRVDTATYADSVPRPLVDLGRCPPHVAQALAVLIEKGSVR